jgi:hypothetical protein
MIDPVPAPDKYGDLLKLTQIGFYIVAAIIAILTYRAARRGLLNTVNTEYQKRVMDRLQRLSEDLYSEFDPTSDTYWAKSKAVDEAVERINEVFQKHRETILKQREYAFGVPVTKDIQRLNRLLDPIISDPFIPDEIRNAVVDFLENRVEVMENVYISEFEKYSTGLAKGKHEPFDTRRSMGLHNRIIDQLAQMGCGVRQIEEEVRAVRALIQDYFDSFNPHRSWWQGKRARRGAKRRADNES